MKVIGYVKSAGLVNLLVGAFTRLSPVRLSSKYQPVYATDKHFPLSAGLVDVIESRQKGQKDWGRLHGILPQGDLLNGAVTELYAASGSKLAHKSWPFSVYTKFKYRTRREHLIRAASLILAELDKHDQAEKDRSAKS